MPIEQLLHACQRRAEILGKVKEILIKNLNLDLIAEQIDDDSPLFGTGLGLDSIDALDLVIGIEEAFSIKVGEDELYVFKSVNSLVDFILERQEAGSVPGFKAEPDRAEMDIDAAGILAPELKAAYVSLRNTSLMMEEKYGILKFPEGEATLQALGLAVSGKLLRLEPNQILHSALLDAEGRVVDLIYVFQYETHYLVLFTPGNEAARALLMSLPVACEDVTSGFRCLALEGPYSWALAKEVLGFEVLGVSYQRFIELSHEDIPLTLSRISSLGEYGFRIFLPAAGFDTVREALRANGSQEFHEVSDASLIRELRAIAATEMRAPFMGITLEPGGSLAEHELRWMIDYSNALIVSKQTPALVKIVGIQASGDGSVGSKLPAGTEIRFEGKAIGRVLYSLYSPAIGAQIGFAAFDPAYGYAGISGLNAEGLPGIRIATVSMPFLLPASSRVQMQ